MTSNKVAAAIEEVVVYLGGDVPVCDYATTGTDGLGVEVASKLGDPSSVPAVRMV